MPHLIGSGLIPTSLRPRTQPQLFITLILFLSLFLLTPIAQAQEGKTILVLDASGSMWQKIEEGYKIKIAQDVINELLVTLPAEQELGLITYGHRRKGDCGDIEMLVPPGAGTRETIATAIKSLNPTGKTPLSAAVIKAADELRIEENAATVILISDGRETCDLDPCAVGIELETRGIDFTTHVIGFDISEENDRAQLRCLAENTGGKFLTASTASELTEALVEVSKPIEKFELTADAVDDNNKLVSELTWSLIAKDNNTAEELLTSDQQSEINLQFEVNPGNYTLSVTRTEDGATEALDINIQNGASKQYRLTLPAIEYTAIINGPDSAVIGANFEVEWEGPALNGDYITIAKAESAVSGGLENTFIDDASTVTIRAPEEPGVYELRYIQNNPLKIIATDSIIIKDAPATLITTDTAPGATSISIEWTGPDQDYDSIAVAKPGQTKLINSERTSSGNPLQLQMPAEAGEYELRYMLFAHDTVLATRPITITDTGTSVTAAQSASTGVRIPVTWTGPDEDYDAIVVTAAGDTKEINSSRTDTGSPLELEMPTTPGDYELHYRSFKFDALLATQPIKVEASNITLNVPTAANVGATISVEWEGPNEDYDVVAIARVGEDKAINDTRTSEGNPLQLQMPTQPGEYEIRYVLFQDSTTLATRPITINEGIVTINAPDEASLGSSVTVNWEGPNAEYDVIALARVGEGKAINDTRTSEGNPLQLQMPTQPGEYEIRYVLYQDNTTIATRPITINEGIVTINAPEEAGLGSSVTVNWEGPNAGYDVIAVAEVGAKNTINETRTSEGNPLVVLVPTIPGNYELRYVLYQDNTTLVTHPIRVTDIEVSLNAPDRVKPSERINIEWIGPDADYDEIELTLTGSEKAVSRVRTIRGNPAQMEMPTEPGEYELRYILGQDSTLLATRPISVAD